jgi:hypothetical protein
MFSDLCQGVLDELQEVGVGRGSARAVAHVGVELMLDGALSSDADTLAVYTQAIAADAAHDLIGALSRASGQEATRYLVLLQRLRGSGIPSAYMDLDFVTMRLQQALAPRRRLALLPDDLPRVRNALMMAQPRVTAMADLLTQYVFTRVGLPPG